jgi:hypothetical protein
MKKNRDSEDEKIIQIGQKGKKVTVLIKMFLVGPHSLSFSFLTPNLWK